MITVEQAPTRDTVTVYVDAIVFWQMEDAQAAAIRIADYRQAIARQILNAAKLYGSNSNALNLRQMNLLYEMNKQCGTTVLISSDMVTGLRAVVALRQEKLVSRATSADNS